LNQRQVRAAIVGACIGAGVGAAYAVVLVTYRDMLAAQQAQRAGKAPEKPCGCKDKETVAESPELADTERVEARAEFISTAERARDLRKAHPELKWQQAMHQAAAEKNGAVHEAEEVSE